MRKLITALPAAALMISSLAFAQQSTSTTADVSVVVSNVCTYNVPDMQNVNGMTYTDSNAITLKYDAIKGGSAKTAFDYIFRCTKDTNFGTPTADFKYTGNQGPVVTPTIVDGGMVNNGNDDIHSYGVQLTAENDQFNVPAGTYSATLTTTVTYN